VHRKTGDKAEMRKKDVLFLIVSCLMVLNCCRKEKEEKGVRVNYKELEKERKAMVVEQIEERGIRDGRVLEVMEKVPRHEFVPEKYRAFAYEDSPLPIGEGQTISQPYIVA
jgi:hypothetical protein